MCAVYWMSVIYPLGCKKSCVQGASIVPCPQSLTLSRDVFLCCASTTCPRSEPLISLANVSLLEVFVLYLHNRGEFLGGTNHDFHSNGNFYSCPLESTQDSSQGTPLSLTPDPGIPQQRASPGAPTNFPVQSVCALHCRVWPPAPLATSALQHAPWLTLLQPHGLRAVPPSQQEWSLPSVILCLFLLLHGNLPLQISASWPLTTFKGFNSTRQWGLWSDHLMTTTNDLLLSLAPSSALFLSRALSPSNTHRYEVYSLSVSPAKYKLGESRDFHLLCSWLTP